MAFPESGYTSSRRLAVLRDPEGIITAGHDNETARIGQPLPYQMQGCCHDED